jgi:hypothetical protein
MPASGTIVTDGPRVESRAPLALSTQVTQDGRIGSALGALDGRAESLIRLPPHPRRLPRHRAAGPLGRPGSREASPKRHHAAHRQVHGVIARRRVHESRAPPARNGRGSRAQIEEQASTVAARTERVPAHATEAHRPRNHPHGVRADRDATADERRRARSSRLPRSAAPRANERPDAHARCAFYERPSVAPVPSAASVSAHGLPEIL